MREPAEPPVNLDPYNKMTFQTFSPLAEKFDFRNLVLCVFRPLDWL